MLAGRDFGHDHLLAEDGFDAILAFAEFFEGVGPDGDIEAEAEELFGADLEFVAEFFGVGSGSFELGVADAVALGIDGHRGFELGDFFTQIFHDDGGVDRVNEHRDVEDFIEVDDGGEPAGVEHARVGVDEDGAAKFGAKLEVAALDFVAGGREEVAQGSDTGAKSVFGLGVFEETLLGGDLGRG